MDGDPIDLVWVHDKTPVRRWRDPDAPPWDEVHVTLGRLGGEDGRWYVHTTERATNPCAWAWSTRALAERQVAELLANRSGWVDVPAWYDHRGQPHGELGPWKPVGRHWVLDQPDDPHV